MALNLQNKYPGRFDPVSADYPQGKFKNRSSPTAQDGSYLERDWLNDWNGFFGALLNGAGISPNGVVDTAQSSQLYDALMVSTSVYPVGAPIPWPTAVPPAGFLSMTGQSFSAATYPRLALAYPSGVIPDMRAMTIKGLDGGRGVDPSRTVLSFQPGSLIYGDDDWAIGASILAGLNVGNRAWSSYGIANPSNYPQARSGSVATTSASGGAPVNFNAVGVAQVDNIAFHYIVRAV